MILDVIIGTIHFLKDLGSGTIRSVTIPNYQKRVNAEQGFGSIYQLLTVFFEMWVLHSKMETDKLELAEAGLSGLK